MLFLDLHFILNIFFFFLSYDIISPNLIHFVLHRFYYTSLKDRKK